MKNVINKNTKILATAALAAVITISMSFKSQEKIEACSTETASIEKMQLKETATSKWPVAVAGAGFAVASAVYQVANFATNYFFGGGKAIDNNTNEKELINSEQAKTSQFD
ncbi:hypothetical protein [Chryseobacterium potabilaquae]|uniref:Uncharacterized protein n=1 Tax=Chryseobacterium potabilaquae TaxID=2675057 RepID=A0A6N4X8B0_9FLAO|nr:hypothetical protein [Chryseobacterium potabilaquae]CAA7195511.1 hypothetical protein CHRY9293_01708 [Chryseobacterium potabilaquae]